MTFRLAPPGSCRGATPVVLSSRCRGLGHGDDSLYDNVPMSHNSTLDAPIKDTRWAPRTWRPLLSLLAVALGVGLAAHAQDLVDRRETPQWALAAYAVGALLYASGARGTRAERPGDEQPARLEVSAPRILWALAFGTLAFAGFGGNRMSYRGLLPWAMAVTLCFLALPRARIGEADPEQGRWQRAWRSLTALEWRLSWAACALILALVVGAFLRFYRLEEHPADLGWDAPYKYTDTQRLLRGEQLIFFPDNYGREGMFIYLAAGVAQAMKLSPYSIRITSSLVGMVTILAFYLLARECANREVAALSALALAVNKWHVVLSRSGFRVSLFPLFAILTLYGLARGLRRGRPRDWAWTGLFMSLGLWTYKAFVFTLPLVAGIGGIYVVGGFLRSRRDVFGDDLLWTGSPRERLGGLALAFLVAAIVATPMLRFLADSPDVYLARELLGVRLVAEDLERAGMTRMQLYLRNLPVSLGMFHYVGDPNPRFGVPFQRHMGYWSGVLFALGTAGALARIRRGANALLVLSVLGYLAPMVVTMRSDELPNCFRSAGVIGPCVVLVGTALYVFRVQVTDVLEGPVSRLLRALSAVKDTDRALLARGLAALPALCVVGGLLYAETRETYSFYFEGFYQHTPDQANYSIALEAARIITDFADGPAYVRLWPYWYDDRGLAVHLEVLGGKLTAGLHEIRPDVPPLQGFAGKMLVLLNPQDEESLRTLQAFFPRWAINEHRFPNGELAIVAFYGER